MSRRPCPLTCLGKEQRPPGFCCSSASTGGGPVAKTALSCPCERGIGCGIITWAKQIGDKASQPRDPTNLGGSLPELDGGTWLQPPRRHPDRARRKGRRHDQAALRKARQKTGEQLRRVQPFRIENIIAQRSVEALSQQYSIPIMYGGGLELYWKHTWRICEPPVGVFSDGCAG